MGLQRDRCYPARVLHARHGQRLSLPSGTAGTNPGKRLAMRGKTVTRYTMMSRWFGQWLTEQRMSFCCRVICQLNCDESVWVGDLGGQNAHTQAEMFLAQVRPRPAGFF
jgi:hypothetical protein